VQRCAEGNPAGALSRRLRSRLSIGSKGHVRVAHTAYGRGEVTDMPHWNKRLFFQAEAASVVVMVVHLTRVTPWPQVEYTVCSHRCFRTGCNSVFFPKPISRHRGDADFKICCRKGLANISPKGVSFDYLSTSTKPPRCRDAGSGKTAQADPLRYVVHIHTRSPRYVSCTNEKEDLQ